MLFKRFQDGSDDHIGERFKGSLAFFRRGCARIAEVSITAAGLSEGSSALLDLFRDRDGYALKRQTNIFSHKIGPRRHHQGSLIRAGVTIPALELLRKRLGPAALSFVGERDD